MDRPIKPPKRERETIHDLQQICIANKERIRQLKEIKKNYEIRIEKQRQEFATLININK
jgi:hypothetical protein